MGYQINITGRGDLSPEEIKRLVADLQSTLRRLTGSDIHVTTPSTGKIKDVNANRK